MKLIKIHRKVIIPGKAIINNGMVKQIYGQGVRNVQEMLIMHYYDSFWRTQI